MRTRFAVLALLAMSSGALAQVEEPKDFPIERFRLSSNVMGINDVEWGAALPHKAWGINLSLSLQDDPLALYDQDGNRLGALVHRRIGGEIGGFIALFDRFEVAIAVPLILSQTRDTANAGIVTGAMLDDLQSFGVADIRITPKIALRKGSGINAALMLGLTVPSGSNTEYRGEDGVSFTPEVAVAVPLGMVRLGANLGYRIRKDQTFLDLDISDEVFARVGAGLRFGSNVPIGVNASFAYSTSVEDFAGATNVNYAEALGGLDATFIGKITPFAIGGIGVAQGFGAPDWRVVGGVRIGTGASGDADGDGILDSSDKCPSEPEDKDGFEDSNGCPDPDNDQDGVLDKDDKAPNDPEDKDGFEDEDGKPDPDNDNDGIEDKKDQCPMEPENANGVEDDDGCPEAEDADGDGITDDKDKCPNNPEDKDGFEDEDGCPDSDNDQDGVLDEKDGCPDKAGPLENNGCPDTDRDGDGVVDRIDNCPDEKGTKERQGCKDKQLVKIGVDKLEILDVVYFRTNKAIINRRSYKLLRQVASVLKNQPRITNITIEGHTDDRGGDEANKDLSQRRAQAVVDFLVAEGVDPSRMTAIGYGEERPVASNGNSAGRAKNRRVEFRITGVDNIQIKRSDPNETIDE